MQRLKGKVALVTGAARGNGEGIARALAREGANVVLSDKADAIKQTAEAIGSLGHQAVWFKMDVRDVNQVNQTVQQILTDFGRIDILVNNAGIYPIMPFVDMTDELRDLVFDTNLKGIWHCAKAVIPIMIKQKYGKMVNISSVTGPMVSMKGQTAYSASKGAVSGFTRALALEAAGYGINVNAICPGYVDTPGVRETVSQMGTNPDEWVNNTAKTVPLGRLGSIDELGDLAVFLASDESKYITGA